MLIIPPTDLPNSTQSLILPMPPAGSPLAFDNSPSPRPLKRARKDGSTNVHHFNSNTPVDHIFIAEGVVSNSKKPSGKKAPLSCCECRRLKLKCDRNFPCSSCKKRGCTEICPDGVLVSGKGTRFILANTEQLHNKIEEMSVRIRNLEEALQSLHGQHTFNLDDPHPLMRSDLLSIKSTMGLYSGAQVDSQTTKQSSEPGRPVSQPVETDHPTVERGSSEDTITVPDIHPSHSLSSKDDSQFASEIARLSHSFPVTDTVCPEPNLRLREYIRSNLPPREDADYLWAQARQNALWQYNPHPSSTFYPNLAYHCYTATIASLSPRRLALLLMILAVGCLVDIPNREPDHADAEKYHQLARASLCEIPVMEETNVETITALFYEIWYLLVFSDKKKAAGYAWGLMGLTAKLAQSIGLHRNGGKSKVIPEEVEKRRSLFWELLYLDARLSLSMGRPPSLIINHMDCPRPSYIPDSGYDPSESLHLYQQWKHDFYLQCLVPVLDAISYSNTTYAAILELDKQIRDFAIPDSLRDKNIREKFVVVQRASLSTAHEAVLLQLHRQFFTRALSGPEEAINRRHKYAPSVVAVFLSATRMIASVEELFNREPQLAARILGYWSNAFSAAVALCLLVTRAPFTCLSPAALQELERARLLFRAAKDSCPRALQVVPVLETMIDKANYIYNTWSSGQELPTIVLKHITDDATYDPDHSYGNKSGNVQHSDANRFGQQNQQQPQQDSFVRTHRSLEQCIVEVHERAKALYPLRKPCQCSSRAAQNCPPSHSWSPVPNVPSAVPPVLPEPPFNLHIPRITSPVSYSRMGNGMYNLSSSFYSPGPNGAQSEVYGGHSEGFSNTVLPGVSPEIPLPPISLSPASKMAVVDTLNFELGALSSNQDQSWMAFF